LCSRAEENERVEKVSLASLAEKKGFEKRGKMVKKERIALFLTTLWGEKGVRGKRWVLHLGYGLFMGRKPYKGGRKSEGTLQQRLNLRRKGKKGEWTNLSGGVGSRQWLTINQAKAIVEGVGGVSGTTGCLGTPK